VGVVVMAVEQTTNREGVTVSSPGDLVYVLRSCKSDGTSHGGFRWPDSGPVECPDWSPAAECGHGLHGLLWGIGDWGLTALSDPNSKWYVVAVPAETVVEIGGKVKFPRGEVVYSGGLPGALTLVAEKRLTHLAAKQPTASTTGDKAPASTTGVSSPASTTGGYAPASATSKHGRACCLGLNGRARAGDLGSLILTRWDDTAGRYRHAVGYVGEGGIEANVWYELDAAGQIVRSPDQGAA
jgi:hypothetical protein